MKDKLLNIFSTRELSLLVWLFVFLISSQFSKSIRNGMQSLVKAFFKTSIITVILLSAVYSTGVIFLLSQIELWNKSMTKDSVFWFVGSALLIVFNLTKAEREKDFFKNIFIDAIKLIVVLEFIVNFHTFGMLTEIIILPIAIFLAMISAYSALKDEYRQVKKLMDIIFVIIGLIMLFLSIRDLMTLSSSIQIADIIKSFLLPIILTVAFLPCAYLIALHMNYEMLFVRLGIFLNRKEDFRYAKKRVILLCRLSLKRIIALSPLINELHNGSTKDDIKRVIRL